MWISARPESYSNMPTSKMPMTRNCFSRGSTAAGVTRPCGAISVTLSPGSDLQRARQFAAENDAELAGTQGSRAGRTFMCRSKSATLLLHLRQDAAHQHTAHLLVERQHALGLHVGRRGQHVGMPAGRVAYRLPIGQFAARPSISGCARRRRGCGRAIPSGSRSSPTGRRSARRRRGRCRASKSAK